MRSAKNTKRPDMGYAGNPQDDNEDKEAKPSEDSDFQLDADDVDEWKPAMKLTPSRSKEESNKHSFPMINCKDVMDEEKR